MQFPTQTQFIKRDTLADLSIILAWVFGVAAPLLISTFGNYIMFSGGWDLFTFPHFMVNSLVGAVVFQVLCVGAQLAFKSKAKKGGGMNWWTAYIISLLVSVVPSFLAYFDGLSPRLVAVVQPLFGASSDGSTPLVVIGLVAFVVLVCAVLVDLLPEWIAVE